MQAFALGLGFLFVSLYGGQLSGLETLLFGSFLGITTGQVLTLLWIAVAALLVARGLVGRRCCSPPSTARSPARRGCRRALLASAFLLLLGLAAAATAQITGALLVFALLVTPAATAQRSPPGPARGLALSVVLALA